MSVNDTRRDFEMNYALMGREMEKAVKKASINNYVKMPKIEVKLGHELWLNKNSQF